MSEDWNRLVPSQEELERAEEERRKRDAQWDRLERRVSRWAESKDKHEVVELLTAVSMILYWERKHRRDWTQSAFQWAETNSATQYQARASMDAARNLAGKLKKTSDDRKRGAAVKLANDPKQAAKAGALELWKERHAGKHPKLRTVSQFATEVMRRWPVLTNHAVICGWSAKWTKDVKAGRTPVC